MNLLENRLSTNGEISNPNFIFIEDFRKNQYDQVDKFLRLIVDYISSQNNNYLKLTDVSIKKIEKYSGIYNSELSQVIVKVINQLNPNAVEKIFLRFFTFTLLDNTFFYLNGNYYVPTLYILDKPISVKKNSVKFASTFNSITVYIEDNICTFTGINIPIPYFLQLFYFDDPDGYDRFITHFGLNLPIYTESELINYFSNCLICDRNITNITQKIEGLFFDDYTKELYRNCYGFTNLTIKDLMNYVVTIQQSPEFIDLKNKRLVFTELLFSPLFKRVGNVAVQASKGYQVDEIKMDQLELIKHFSMGLHNKFFYNNTNLFSAILQQKVSFINPGSDNAPSSIANLHPTHYKRICPITISNQDVGETISLIPSLQIDRFGQFVFEEVVRNGQGRSQVVKCS